MANEKQETAAHRYAVNREQALSRLTRLMEHVNSPEARELSDKHWGHVGNMAHLNDELKELMVFFGLEKEEE